MIYGIDISEHQHSDFDIRKYQHDFVIIRAGYGLTEDPLFRQYADQAKRMNVPMGVYWYSYACDPAAGIREAKKCLEVISGYDIQVGVWIDMEDADKYKRNRGALTPYVCTGVCKNFCDTIAAAGYHAGIYASDSWFGPKSFITNTYGYDKWIARWYDGTDSKAAEMSGRCSIWQYRGAPLDLDLCFVPLSWFGGKDLMPVENKTLEQLAREVIRGEWGSGQHRKDALTAAGYNYRDVQTRVNMILSGQSSVDDSDIHNLALDVIAGIYGNGLTRRVKLGSKYDAVQAEVNRILNSK